MTSRVEGLRAVLRESGFRRLVGTQIASQAADGLYQIAVAAIVIFNVSAARTPGQVTKVLAVTLLPFSLVGPFTGPFIDRFSRRSILVGTSAVRAALTFLLIPAISWPEPALLGVVVANMSVNRFFHATKSTVLPTLVPRERYLVANSVSSVAGMVFGLLGAVVGGPVADLVSERAVVLSAAILMVVAAILAASLRLPRGERRGLVGILGELREDARDVVDGVRTLVRAPRATYAISAVWTMRALLGFLLLAGIVLLRTRFDLRVGGTSALLGAIAAGGFLGAVAVPAIARRIGDARVPPVAFASAGALVLALAAVPAWPAVVATLFVGGVAMSTTKITADTLVQRSIGDRYRGRAFAVYDIGYNGMFVVAALIPTLLVSAVGEIGIVFVAGGLALVAALALARASARLPSAIEVRTYSGARGDEVPRAVVRDGESMEVAEVERSWQEDRAGERLLVFRLRLADGSRIEVSRGEAWRLDRRLPAASRGEGRT